MPARPAGKALLATQRLALREFHAGDAENLHRLNRDPRVMRYIGDGSVGTRASATAAIGGFSWPFPRAEFIRPHWYIERRVRINFAPTTTFVGPNSFGRAGTSDARSVSLGRRGG